MSGSSTLELLANRLRTVRVVMGNLEVNLRQGSSFAGMEALGLGLLFTAADAVAPSPS